MAAGTVTSDDGPFRAMVAARSPGMLDAALACRALLVRLMPALVEVVWADQGTAGYGDGPRKMTDQFAWLAPAAAHVTFGLYAGALLPDPAGLLEGTGARMRHVKARTPADAEAPELAELVRAGMAELATRR